MTQQQIDEWNEIFPIGSPCLMRYEEADRVYHTTSAAWMLDGRAVVSVDGPLEVFIDKLKMLETHLYENATN